MPNRNHASNIKVSKMSKRGFYDNVLNDNAVSQNRAIEMQYFKGRNFRVFRIFGRESFSREIMDIFQNAKVFSP